MYHAIRTTRKLGERLRFATARTAIGTHPEAFITRDRGLRAIAAGILKSPRVDLELRGTAFQLEVWRKLLAIPRGETRTYAQLAAELGRPQSVRAVARACAMNRVGVLVPCHRVIRTDGSLAGYRWGIERKRALLAYEARASVSS